MRRPAKVTPRPHIPAPVLRSVPDAGGSRRPANATNKPPNAAAEELTKAKLALAAEVIAGASRLRRRIKAQQIALAAAPILNVGEDKCA